MTTTGESDDNGGTARSLCSSSSSPSPSRGDDDDNHATVVVLRVTDRDVLCGRGMGIRRHPGNVVYNDLLRASHEAYKTAPKGSKAKIVEGIVRYVREGRQQPDGNGGDVEKGRFLERRPNRGGGDDDDRWIFVDIGHERAMLKTAQALRDIKATSGMKNDNRWRLYRLPWDHYPPRRAAEAMGEPFRGMTDDGAMTVHRAIAAGEAASVDDDDDRLPKRRRSPPPRRPTFRERIAMLRRRESLGGRDSESDGDTDDDDDDDDDGGTSGEDDDDDDVSDTETEDSFSMYESPIKRRR